MPGQALQMGKRGIIVGETPTPLSLAPTLTSHNPLIPSYYPHAHTDRSTALVEVAKCSLDLTVQGSVRDPEIIWEAVKLRVCHSLAQ